MPRNPIVLIHGYSDDGAAFRAWERILEKRGYDVTMTHACSYRSLTNEPFTPTLIEVRLNREPLPPTGKNEVAWF